MKCMETNPLNAYMEGQLSQSESIRFEKHLESCKDCQLQLEHWINKHEDFEDSWEEEVSDEAFMQNILDQLTPYTPSEDTNPAEVVIDSPKLINWKQRSLDIMKKITIAAVGLAVVISLGTYVPPTFANYAKSFSIAQNKLIQG
ncbi:MULTISPECIES: anti-sigma factor family protein [unclassified Paenibacillus]|uniref:anti-sigma factor family protein n=1 Tax=unclassified Paenibacillus TaxID=185978 RepID=UPI00363DC36C